MVGWGVGFGEGGGRDGSAARMSDRVGEACRLQGKEFFMNNLLARIHFIIEMIWWTGLAPWEFEFPFPGILTSTLLTTESSRWSRRSRGSGAVGSQYTTLSLSIHNSFSFKPELFLFLGVLCQISFSSWSYLSELVLFLRILCLCLCLRVLCRSSFSVLRVLCQTTFSFSQSFPEFFSLFEVAGAPRTRQRCQSAPDTSPSPCCQQRRFLRFFL